MEIRRNSTFSSDSISPFFTGPVIITWAGSTDTAAVEFLKNWTKFCQFEYLRYHNIYWDLTRCTEISQDLLRSHKIYWDLTRSSDFAKYIWHLIFELLLLTLTCHDIPFDIWHLLRSHKIYWFGIIHSTFGIWLWVNRNMDLKDAAFLKSKKEEKKRVHLLLGR